MDEKDLVEKLGKLVDECFTEEAKQKILSHFMNQPTKKVNRLETLVSPKTADKQKAFITIELEIPDYELIRARAILWEKANDYNYKDDTDQLVVDYLMSNVNTGYSIKQINIVEE
jgi:hypothetical protein